jgi:putative membrane protein
MYWHMDGDWGWWMWFGWLWMVVFWGLIIGAVVLVIRRLSPAGGQPRDAIEILRTRYAAGEIDEAEFRRRRDELSAPPRP